MNKKKATMTTNSQMGIVFFSYASRLDKARRSSVFCFTPVDFSHDGHVEAPRFSSAPHQGHLFISAAFQLLYGYWFL